MTGRIVSFTQMKHGTRADYELLEQSELACAAALPDQILAALRQLDHSLDGYPISRLGHVLQVATRAEADGADDEMIMAALLHDVGDILAPYNHAEFAAAIIRPYVRPEVSWVVEQHGLFQNYYYVHHFGGDRNARDKYRSHPWFDSCAGFCETWDQASFDPAYPTKPLGHFEPLVRRIFSRKAHDPRYQAEAF